MNNPILLSTQQSDNQQPVIEKNTICLLPEEWAKDTVIMTPRSSFNLFIGNRRKTKVLKITRITDDREKHQVFCRVRTMAIKGLSNDHIALSYSALHALYDNGDVNKFLGKPQKDIDIEKSWEVPYFWYNPNNEIRVPYKLALLSLGISFISLIITLINVC